MNWDSSHILPDIIWAMVLWVNTVILTRVAVWTALRTMDDYRRKHPYGKI
jgi:hypothetical protein